MTLKNQYDTWHVKRGECEHAAAPLTHPWHITAARVLPDLIGQRVLEIGCGRGDFAMWLEERAPGADITAVDFSDAAIDIAKRRAAAAGREVRFEVGDAQSLRFDDASFDVIVSCECLEHVPHPERMIEEMYRLLRPGGQFVLTTPNYCNGLILAWIKFWLTGKPYDSGAGVQPHENFFLFWRVKQMLERGGLVVNHMESNIFQWLLLPRVAPAELCVKDFKSPVFKRLFRPFGLHFTFCGTRPESTGR